MLDTDLQEGQVDRRAPASLKQVATSMRFDWIMIVLCGWLPGGVYIEGWARNHFNVIDTLRTRKP